jgi:hypothetical protein
VQPVYERRSLGHLDTITHVEQHRRRIEDGFYEAKDYEQSDLSRWVSTGKSFI